MLGTDFIFRSRIQAQEFASPDLENRTKVPFENEHHLVNEFSSMIGELSPYMICREFDCSYGIADLVLFSYVSKNISTNRIGDIPSAWAYTLHQLPYRKVFLTKEFSDWNSVSLAKAKEVLKKMYDAEFLKRGSATDSWIKVKQPQAITNNIIAIEAKLNKWRQALNQATRYKHFAHQSWVLLDAKNKGAAVDNIQIFQKFNIGLASMSACGELVVHFSPIKSLPKSPRLFWMANSKMATQIKL